ncbi:hypothetical protein E0W60_35920 (plasmid) [Cupriavidus oxalaticus]|uniref:Uncharacterized protein n=1 Tax=Cupriavidus oxalaticus TaxID=96344 RepID=A0A4P7LK14_9BURK|nr:hypothetical protein E0W60_35920 [Cupriavidus oxalaticus]
MDAPIYGTGLASYPAGVTLHVGFYDSSLRPAIQLLCADDGMPYASLTVNVPAVDLSEGEICIASDWNMPSDLKASLLATGKFADMGQRGGSVWRITCPNLLSEVAAARLAAIRPRLARRPAPVV